MKYPDDLVPDIASATLYRYYLAIREQVALRGQSKETRHTAAAAMHKAAQVAEIARSLYPSDIRCKMDLLSSLKKPMTFARLLMIQSDCKPLVEGLQQFAPHTCTRCEVWREELIECNFTLKNVTFDIFTIT